VVHRDIKPANILISSGEAVVADFGIARAIDAASDVRLTAAGTSTGTPWYMSPEQAAGNDDVDGRSDIYALGCVLYEMLAGTPPFAGTEAQKVIMRQISEAPRPIRQIREVVPESVERALLCALAKLPADRFPAAGEFARALEPSGGVPGYEHVALKPPVSRRGRLSRAAAVLIPVALAAGFFLTRSFRPREQHRRRGLRSVAQHGAHGSRGPVAVRERVSEIESRGDAEAHGSRQRARPR
jgi:serine/threonine-protein kinase